MRPLRLIGGAVVFLVGALVTVAGGLTRDVAVEGNQPRFIALAALAVGSLGLVVVNIGLGLMQGKNITEAVGIDESRRTSRVTLVAAGLLFVPLWLAGLGLTAQRFLSGDDMLSAAVSAAMTAFLSVLVWALVRAWKR